MNFQMTPSGVARVGRAVTAEAPLVDTTSPHAGRQASIHDKCRSCRSTAATGWTWRCWRWKQAQRRRHPGQPPGLTAGQRGRSGSDAAARREPMTINPDSAGTPSRSSSSSPIASMRRRAAPPASRSTPLRSRAPTRSRGCSPATSGTTASRPLISSRIESSPTRISR